MQINIDIDFILGKDLFCLFLGKIYPGTFPAEAKEIVKKIVDANPNQVEAYKNGKTNLLGFFVGQVMKETKGRANPKTVNELVREMLEG